MRFGLAGKNVPDALMAKVQAYVDGYVLYDHVLRGGRNPRRMEELGLAEYAIERFALAGNPADWIRRIEAIAETGATKLWVSVNGDTPDAQQRCMRLLGEQIMARFLS